MSVTPMQMDEAASTVASAPLHYRLHLAADWVAELNAMQGLPSERASVSPKYLREEAGKMERRP